MTAAKAIATQNVENLPIMPAASESAAILSVIERMATNPDIDPERIERFIALKERMEANAARKAFAAALSELQADLPVIEERGKIEVRKKTQSGERDGEVQQSTSYALWEDINEAIKPHLKTHGFALSFRTGQSTDGRVTVTGILSHREGHQEETTMVLQHDSTGSKNAVQAIGSSTSYGKRYTAAALLNLTSRGEDDDGKAAGQTASKADSRGPYAEMQAAVDACMTLPDLSRLWQSKAFQIELAKLPKDWVSLITERKNDRKDELTQGPSKPGYVPPTFTEEPGDNIPY